MHEEDCPDIGPICRQRAEPPQEHHTLLWFWELRLLAEYGLTPSWALDAVLPFRAVDTRTTYTDLSNRPLTLGYANIHHRNETLAGPSDPQLWAHHAWHSGSWLGSERMGVSLPLGRVEPNPYVLGAEGLPHEHIQFGTGTFDPLVGLDVARSFSKWSAALFAQAQLPLYSDHYGYKAGSRLLGGISASSHLGLKRPMFRLNATAVHELAERWEGTVPNNDGNQGRSDVFLGPGVTLPFATDWTVSLDAQAHAWGHVVGAQLSMPVVLAVSIGRLFHFEPNGDSDLGAALATTADVASVVEHGEVASLTPVPGKWTLYDFWATWCEACRRLEPRLRALAEQHAELAVRRVNVVDLDSPISRATLSSVSVLPHVRLLDSAGKVVFEASGTPDELMAGIEKWLAGDGYSRGPRD